MENCPIIIADCKTCLLLNVCKFDTHWHQIFDFKLIFFCDEIEDLAFFYNVVIVFWFFSWGQFYKESWMPVGESTVWYFLWWIFVYYYTLGSYYNNDLLLGYVWIYHLCHNFTAKYDKPDLNLPQYLTFVMIEIIIMESLFAFYVSFFKINISMLEFTSIGPLPTLKLMCIYYGYSKFYIIIFIYMCI